MRVAARPRLDDGRQHAELGDEPRERRQPDQLQRHEEEGGGEQRGGERQRDAQLDAFELVAQLRLEVVMEDGADGLGHLAVAAVHELAEEEDDADPDGRADQVVQGA